MSTLAKIEALLFVAGEDGIRIRQLAELLSLPPTGIQQSLEKLVQKYEKDPDSSLALIETGGAYRLVTKPQFAAVLKEYSKAPINQSLSRAALETLSIIAYKQPVTRLEIERVRGVSCDHAINKLLEYDLITELGRLDAPGRPLLFGTTEQFLRCFGVKSLEELPELNPVQVEEFKQQAEQEVQLTLNI